MTEAATGSPSDQARPMVGRRLGFVAATVSLVAVFAASAPRARFTSTTVQRTD
jgi:hypothetical protein